MSINNRLNAFEFVFLSSFILLSYISLIFNPYLHDNIIYGQETNSTNNDEILLNINQTYLSLIPLMIKEVENTNATDIPIKQIMDATPSNVTALQDIVKNNSDKSNQNEVNSTMNSTTTNAIAADTSSKPQDLIPVIVNMTQNTNASDLGVMRIINATPDLSNFKPNPLNSSE